MKSVLVRFFLGILLLGGVLQIAPVLQARQQAGDLVVVSAATLELDEVAPGSLATIFGQRLATTTASATDVNPNEPGVQLPLVLGGTTVRVGGQLAQLLFVSPSQINFRVPDPLLVGIQYNGADSRVEVLAADGTSSTGALYLTEVAPGFFTANGSGRGLPVGFTLRLRPTGTQLLEPLFAIENGVVVPRPVALGVDNSPVFLVLYTTGLRNVADPDGDDNLRENVRVLMNGYEVTPSFVGSVPGVLGIEQINVELPRTFWGQPKVALVIEVLGEQETPYFTQLVEVPLAFPPGNVLPWQPLALAGKPVRSLASRDNTILAGTDEGVYRNVTGSVDWKLASYGLPGERRTLALLSESFLSGVPAWIAATDGGGVWFSSDDGLQWTWFASSANSLLNNVKTLALAANSTRVFVGTDNLGVVRANISASDNLWTVANPQFTARVAALATNGTRVLAGTATQGLFLSTDNGNNWTQNTNGIPANAEIRALRSLGSTFLAGAASGLYRSTDNGVSWTRITDGVPATAINAFHSYSNVVLAGTDSSGVLVSTDGGLRWQTLNNGLAGQRVLALVQRDARIFAGTQDGLYVATLSEPVNQPPVAEAQAVTLDEDTPKAITLRGSDPNNDRLTYDVVSSPSHGELTGTGANLVYVPDPDFFGEDQFEFRANDGKLGSLRAVVKLTVRPVSDPPKLTINGERLLLTGQFADLRIVPSDADTDIPSINPPLKVTVTGLPAGAQFRPNTLLADAAFYRLLWVPETAGTYTINFTVTDFDSPPNSTTQSVTLRVADNPEKGAWTARTSPARAANNEQLFNLFVDGSDLYAVTISNPNTFNALYDLWRSMDGGQTWKAAGQGLSGSEPKALVRQGNKLFLGTLQGLYSSPAPAPDGAPVWTALTNGLAEPRAVYGLAVRDNKLVLITQTEVYQTTNQGDSWTKITSNLPLRSIPVPLPTVNSLSAVVFSGDALFVSIRYPASGIIAGAGDEAHTEDASAESATDAAQQATVGVFRSTDNGAYWQSVNNGLVGVGPTSLLYYPITALSVSGTSLFATNGFNLFRSINQGDRWTAVPLPDGNYYLSFPVGGLGAADDDAPTTSASFVPSQIIFSGTSYEMPFVAQGGRLFAVPYNRGIYTSPDNGSDWLPANLGLPEPAILRLVAAGNRLYTVVSYYNETNSQTTGLFVRNLPSN